MPKKAKTDSGAADTAAPKKTVRKTKSTKKATKVVATPEPVEVVNKTVEEKSVSSSGSVQGNDLSDSFHEFVAKLQAVCSSMQSLKSEFKQLEKKFNRELKAAQKAASKKKRKTGNRQPSGFVKPTLISSELATEMARTEVTREINKYIREHNLQDKENGRKINADKALSKLLKLGKEDQLTYFNLQKFMSPHFAKAGQTVVGGTSA